MTSWSNDLSAALASGDVERMKATLAKVPKNVLYRAVPQLLEMARAGVRDNKFDEALVYYDQIVLAAADRIDPLVERAGVYLRLGHYDRVLEDARRIVGIAPGRAIGHRLQAEAHEGLDEAAEALNAYRQVLRLEPGDAVAAERIADHEAELRKRAVLRQALDPDASQEALHIEPPPAPPVSFDPALFDDPSIPVSFETFRVDGLRQHLLRYSAQQSPRNALNRLEDPMWTRAWDDALARTAGARVVLRGSELGVFAIRAARHGAMHALCAETHALDARIATGMVQKHFLAPWHALHGEAIREWSEEQRRASFEDYAQGIDIVHEPSLRAETHPGDWFAFPNIDHSLLGTGIVKAVREYRGDGGAPLRVLPARATVFAMAVRWDYPDAGFRLDALERLRWSAYPQALGDEPGLWTALTAPMRVGEIDFERFEDAVWDVDLPVTEDGRVGAIVYWFELELGDTRVGNAPGGGLRCIRPAAQYVDAFEVAAGAVLPVRVRVGETRLHFETVPARTLHRAHGLPNWYVPMLGDRLRNQAYRTAITRAVADKAPRLTLDIGAGNGLLSMMAAQAGAERVIACESQRTIAEVGAETLAANGFADRVALVEKDCRQLRVAEDLPERADLAVFELFDCSLIGEGILHFLAYAREHLLDEDARFLPAGAVLRAMVIEYRYERILDVDANLLNPYRFSPTFVNVDARTLPYRALSAPFDLFEFDFASAGPTPDSRELTVPALAAGTAGAVLFWFDLRLDAHTTLSNAPFAHETPHWKQGLQFLPEVRVEPEAPLALNAIHNGSGLKLQWREGAMPTEAFSRLPRFDPRWLAASNELEIQTRDLMQHCAQNPGEYAIVAEIAKRFAVDPAAHGLDPVIAQRFASIFLNA